jgi:glycerol uptake facilitator-like aquaporin
MSIARRAAAEFTGTALLLAVVVGSGIMGERLAGGNVAIALLANALATGFGLFALIVVFGPRSGAHFNPLVTLAFVWRKEFETKALAPYIVAQVAGALAGVALAHGMFDLPVLQVSDKLRTGIGQWLSEATATFGLLLVVLSTCTRERAALAPAAIGAYIAAAYWFTASTSFANPAVTLARGFTATFAGIDPSGIAPFIAAQVVGAGAALAANRYFEYPRSTP